MARTLRGIDELEEGQRYRIVNSPEGSDTFEVFSLPTEEDPMVGLEWGAVDDYLPVEDLLDDIEAGLIEEAEE